MAGLARAQLSSLYSYAIKQGYLGDNPVDRTENRPSKPRARVLNEKEIALIWQATEQPTDFHVIVRLLLLTAARLDMIAGLLRPEIKLEESRIEIPANRMKNDLDFWVPLSRQAKAILANVIHRRVDSSFVFGEGAGGFCGYAKSIERLRDRMIELNGEDIPHWTLHDFRRTVVTLGVDTLQLDWRYLDLCLSHKGGGVRDGAAGNYNHARFITQKTEVLQAWGDYVDRLVHGKREFKIV